MCQTERAPSKISPDVREVLLKRLLKVYDLDRLKMVAALLWKYTKSKTAWGENKRLENAQRLTALNFLDPDQAQTWRRNAKERLGKMSGEEDWAMAMIRWLEKVDSYYTSPEDIVKYVTAKIVLVGEYRE